MRAAAAGAVGALLAVASSCTQGPPPVSGERALEHVREQVAMGPRVPGTPGHAAIRAWIARGIARTGGRLEDQSFVDTTLHRPLEVHNLIARFGPAGVRRIALCAHYDSRPWCDRDPDAAYHDKPMPGANDGGSGVAVLLEVAEALRVRTPRVGVDLVFLDAEDLGTEGKPEGYCLGAKGYAARLPAPGDPARPVAAILFDMVGDRDLQIYDEGTSASRAASLVQLVHDAARATGATHVHPEVRWTIVDDHVPLLDAGLPAVDVIDFDYPVWHTHLDLPGQLSPASLAEVAGLADWIVFASPLARP